MSRWDVWASVIIRSFLSDIRSWFIFGPIRRASQKILLSNYTFVPSACIFLKWEYDLYGKRKQPKRSAAMDPQLACAVVRVADMRSMDLRIRQTSNETPERPLELLSFGVVFMTVFTGALAAINPSTPGMAVAFGTLAAFGIGLLLVPPAAVVACVVTDHLIATAVALVVTLRFVGGAIGYTIYYAIFTNKITSILPTEVGAYAVGAGLAPADATEFVTTLLTAPAQVATLPCVTPAILVAAAEGSRWAYSKALTYVWYTSIPFGVVALVIAVMQPDIRKWMTSHVAVNIGRK
ncbi:Putative major facilitator transporter Str1/Tri12 [Septoria linicola]|uniref:Major facilitator transporter Str1/Tri12 n=1 Tax=Septoria linicola TaxID=215465 RepID=A0A9Q9ARD1_9PEZI|nr:Putative major facilitator transporter Str1/Tri12 [Septoria linicola]